MPLQTLQSPRDLLTHLAQLPQLSQLQKKLKKDTFVWNSVHESAIGFAAALLTHFRQQPLCFVCQSQTFAAEFAEDLLTWFPGGILLPESPASLSQNFLPDPESLADWLRAIEAITSSPPPPWLIVTSSQLELPVPVPASTLDQKLIIQPGTPRGQILEALERWKFERASQVTQRGQFAERGGILDFFSWQADLPVRIDFFGEDVDSLRSFDPESQTSIAKISQASLIRQPELQQNSPLKDLLQNYHQIWIDTSDKSSSPIPDGVPVLSSILDPSSPSLLPLRHCHEADFAAGDFLLNESKRNAFLLNLQFWLKANWTVVAFCSTNAEQERLVELLAESKTDKSKILFFPGLQNLGFVCEPLQLIVLTGSSLFGKHLTRRTRRIAARHERLIAARSIDDLAAFEPGDYVVHIDHGIGRFLGITRLDADQPEVLEIEYANEARLYVPLEEAWRVTRYIGLGKKHPELNILGSVKWENTKRRAKAAILTYARQMLQLQAERSTLPGFAFPPDNDWQREFEEAFPFRLTPDQARAIAETKNDMENPRPMDRLICGDVGFGKTEVAIRAAFKAVMGGKQVAFLTPTTVLAHQHFQTLCERVSQFPVRVELLARTRSAREQSAILRELRQGKIDILVGTHRILSPDVQWHNLGLLIVDEEQRFGVRHKEILKERFRLVDVLTLSATPIPRTLYLALMGARDMSLIETPPPNRQPIETIICNYDERIIRDAIRRELDRGGQVFFLHNRIASIEHIAKRIRYLVPSARIAIAHGQMPEHQLEDTMRNFVEGKIDVLVSTTIIESGLDIPNANTILIDRADRFGLADLYQLRGRVGRAGTKAVAYLLLQRELLSTTAAHKRISAIQQYTQLGSGFRIAMRDLEIRGAGNLLGTAQSGHIIAIGFDLYCKLLRAAIESLTGSQPQTCPQSHLSLDFVKFLEADFRANPSGFAGAFLPENYIRDSKTRIEAYRKFHEATSPQALQKIQDEWRDRFGPLPTEAQNLLLTAQIRFAAGQRHIQSVSVRESKLILKKNEDLIQIAGKFPRLAQTDPNQRLLEVLEKIQSLPTPKKPTKQQK